MVWQQDGENFNKPQSMTIFWHKNMWWPLQSAQATENWGRLQYLYPNVDGGIYMCIYYSVYHRLQYWDMSSHYYFKWTGLVSTKTYLNDIFNVVGTEDQRVQPQVDQWSKESNTLCFNFNIYLGWNVHLWLRYINDECLNQVSSGYHGRQANRKDKDLYD